ncbi:MAG: carotenoid 1,2-hydratase [Pseudomonadales bacterium]|nr:carotenoid 1,2-hydratase [Pseudomonadales bacterium]
MQTLIPQINHIKSSTRFWCMSITIATALSLLYGGQQESPDQPTLSLAAVLGGEIAPGFKTADQVMALQFPLDHGPHPAYRNEWWYFSGNLVDEQGLHFAYMLSFFRIAILAPGTDLSQQSHWASRHIWMAHIALSDVANNRHLQQERFSRGQPGMAGVTIKPLTLWLDNWQVKASAEGFPWQISVNTADFSLQLQISPVKAMVLQGERGFSQKSPGHASYYYSYPRLQTSGTLKLQGKQHQLTGLSWFDREWSSSALGDDQVGWDWFALQLDDGNDLMYYQLRDTQGQAQASSQGKWMQTDGTNNTIRPKEIDLQVLRYWRDESGTNYPVQWSLSYKTRAKRWIITALIDDQLMHTAVKYWEGAVQITDPDSKKILGRGYLEMTGY